ncbi:MAG TPA: cytochrome c biogenesis protein ResB, partial [Phycisphaerales bacterium]|nr:cytochrome c biogenesis protein ResB [Phycisphaerales bacterium]
TRALYLREIGSKEWVQRPIHGLPFYNDYVATPQDVWIAPGEQGPPLDPLYVQVPPVDPNDPLPGVTLSISRYLRYAYMDSKLETMPNAAVNPTAIVHIRNEQGQSEEYELQALNPDKAVVAQGNLQMLWVKSDDDIKRLMETPRLHVEIVPAGAATLPEIPDPLPPDASQPDPAASQPQEFDLPITSTLARDPDLKFQAIPGTDYSFRVERIQPNLKLDTGTVTVAIVEFKSPTRHFRRWVFERPEIAKDFAVDEKTSGHDEPIELDTELQTAILPPSIQTAPLAVLMGPGENDLALVMNLDMIPVLHAIQRGEPVPLGNGVTMRVDEASIHPVRIQKPFIVPRSQQNKNVAAGMSMIQLDAPTPSGSASIWLRYHEFAFENEGEVLRRFPYQPGLLQIPMADGSVKAYEFMFSRERMPLPAPVALDDFILDSHVGGYSGTEGSIRDWTSVITFNKDGTWDEPRKVSVNKPCEFDGYWFYQAQWDPPDEARFSGDTSSAGLNYTVLGVGNRNGVHVQLAGACIAVLGMIYSFYVKPMIRRRRQLAVQHNLTALKASAAQRRGTPSEILLSERET